MSTAEMAIAQSPCCPRLRTALRIAAHAACGDRASTPRTASASLLSMSLPADASAYVNPRPFSNPPAASTRTSVVEFHSRVPSDSGSSVGTSNAATCSRSIATSLVTPRHAGLPIDEIGELGAEGLADDASAVGIALGQRKRHLARLVKADVRR